MGRVQGKVAFITGAARGQGRSHAVRLAEEGADIIAADLCHDIETIGYPMATPDDMKETVRLVEAQGQRIVAVQADVRERSELAKALEQGMAELGGRLDIVVAQAGVVGMKGKAEAQLQAWTDVMDTNLLGTINAMSVALPHLREGASVIAAGSTAAYVQALPMMELGTDPGGMGYMVSKRMLSEYMHDLARNLTPRSIRANVIHPTNVATDMLFSKPMYETFRPDLEQPTRKDAEEVFPVQQGFPIPYIEPVDISNAVLFLASDESRYITGMQLRVDAGGYLKWYDFHL
jgi:SDR family mycofactocin-dependent oxidoreductase